MQIPSLSASRADDVPDAPPSSVPTPHAYKPESLQYPHVPAASAHSSNPPHAPPCASRNYAAAYAGSPLSLFRKRSAPSPKPTAASAAFRARSKTVPAASHPALTPDVPAPDIAPTPPSHFAPAEQSSPYRLYPAPEPAPDPDAGPPHAASRSLRPSSHRRKAAPKLHDRAAPVRPHPESSLPLPSAPASRLLHLRQATSAAPSNWPESRYSPSDRAQSVYPSAASDKSLAARSAFAQSTATPPHVPATLP